MATVTKFANASTVVTTGWTNPSNAFAADGVFATAAPAKNATVNSDFAFPAFTTSDIPAGSTINSVTAEVTWKVSTTSSIATLGLQIMDGGVAQGSETVVTTEPTAATVATQQVTSVAQADLQTAGTVKARVRTSRGNNNTAVTGSLDYVKLTVDYTPGEPPTYGFGAHRGGGLGVGGGGW